MEIPPVLKEVIVTGKPPFPGSATALDWAGDHVLKYDVIRKVGGSEMTVEVITGFVIYFVVHLTIQVQAFYG